VGNEVDVQVAAIDHNVQVAVAEIVRIDRIDHRL
jgi:hypothetical protein